METGIKSGDVYIGLVTKERFTVLFVGKRHSTDMEEVYLMRDKLSNQIRASVPLFRWLIKSGGLIKA